MMQAAAFLHSYHKLERSSQTFQKSKLESNVVIAFFTVGIGASILSHFHIINFKLGMFFAIELAFSVLLFVEVFDMLFIITHSVAVSVGNRRCNRHSMHFFNTVIFTEHSFM